MQRESENVGSEEGGKTPSIGSARKRKKSPRKSRKQEGQPKTSDAPSDFKHAYATGLPALLEGQKVASLGVPIMARLGVSDRIPGMDGGWYRAPTLASMLISRSAEPAVFAAENPSEQIIATKRIIKSSTSKQRRRGNIDTETVMTSSCAKPGWTMKESNANESAELLSSSQDKEGTLNNACININHEDTGSSVLGGTLPVLRSLCMTSELDQYVHHRNHQNQRGRTDTLSKMALPFIHGGRARGPINRPHSPHQPLMERQKTRFGQRALWQGYTDSKTPIMERLTRQRTRIYEMQSSLKGALKHDK